MKNNKITFLKKSLLPFYSSNEAWSLFFEFWDSAVFISLSISLGHIYIFSMRAHKFFFNSFNALSLIYCWVLHRFINTSICQYKILLIGFFYVYFEHFIITNPFLSNYQFISCAKFKISEETSVMKFLNFIHTRVHYAHN